MANEYHTLTLEAKKYLCGLIREISQLKAQINDDDVVSTDKVWSNYYTQLKLDQKEEELKEYTKSLLRQTLQSKVVKNEPDVVDMVENTIYLVEHRTTETDDQGQQVEVIDYYNQMMLIEGQKVNLGTTKIDLSDYYHKIASDERFVKKEELIDTFDETKTKYSVETPLSEFGSKSLYDKVVAQIPTDIETNVPEWKANTEYKVGELVRASVNGYDELLKCVTAHTSSTTININAWEIVSTQNMPYVISGGDMRQNILNYCARYPKNNRILHMYQMSPASNSPNTSITEWFVDIHYRSGAYIYVEATRLYSTSYTSTLNYCSKYACYYYNNTWTVWKDISRYYYWELAYTWSSNLVGRMPQYTSAWSINCNGWPTYRGSISSTRYMTTSNNLNISQGISESSGIQFDGDGITMWSPCDRDSLVYIDEDGDGDSYVWKRSNSGTASSSDIRLKKNIEYVERENVLDKIDTIKPCYFQYNTYEDAIVNTEYETKANEIASELIYEYLDDEVKEQYESAEDYYEKESARLEKKAKRVDRKDNQVHYGVIAQEIQENFPECIDDNDPNGYLGVYYEKFGLYAIEGVKALHQEVKDLRTENDELKARLKAIEDAIQGNISVNMSTNISTMSFTGKTVVCITTKKVFQSLKEGAEYYGIKNPNNISKVCKGERESIGTLEDGTPLVWKFYNDLSDEELEMLKDE